MEGSQEWLNRFPKEWRGAINNWFLRFVREGENDPRRICHRVFALMKEQSDHDTPGTGVQRREVLRQLAADPEGALLVARYGLWYESLPPEERMKEKTRRASAGLMGYIEKYGIDGPDAG